jgi:hypothetical protein
LPPPDAFGYQQAMKLEPVIQIPAAWTGSSGGFGVHLFHGHLTLADMDRLDAFSTPWRRRNPGKMVELSVLFPSDARMSSDERTRMNQVMLRWQHLRLASATVILATGILGALQRSVVTGLLLVAPRPHPTRVYSTVREAVTWLAPHLQALPGFQATPDQVVAGIEEFSAAFRAQWPAR